MLQKKRTLGAAALAAALTLSFGSALAGQGNSPIQTVLTTEGTAPPSADELVAQRVQARPARTVVIRWLRRELTTYQKVTREREQLMGLPLTRTYGRHLPAMSVSDLKLAVARWRRWAHRVLVQFRNPPHKADWLCIHSYEGSWTDPAAPYYGGLQMDMSFQATYGARLLRQKGTADHWTPLEQMWVAEKAFPGRGFYPWPNTARYCGLL